MSKPIADLRASDVAQMFGCSVKTVLRLARRGRLRGYKVGDRDWRFKPSDVEVFRRPVHPVAAPAAPKTRVRAKHNGAHPPGWHDFDYGGRPS